IAARHPTLVRNLVLVAGWMKTDLHQTLRNSVWQALYDAKSPLIREFTVFCASGAPFLASKTAGDMAPALAGVVADDFVAAQMDLNRRIDIADLVPTIRARTLVIGCTYDNMVPRHHAKALFGAIDDARYTEIAAGHGVVFERAPELLRQVERFAQAPDAHPAGSVIPALKA
ncbi:MAG TPA: alpha/beta hydrolase, partial [Paenirhodobacter sp.]